MKSYQLSDVDHPQIVFECGHHKIETEMMKNIKKNPNFSKSNNHTIPLLQKVNQLLFF